MFAKLRSFGKKLLKSDFNGLRFANVPCETGGENGDLGYARVSTHDQDLRPQIDALKAAGVTTAIYREKISGARADRPQLARMMSSLKAGDVVTVTKLDRLGRSTRELLDLIDRIGKRVRRSALSVIRCGILRARKADCSRLCLPASPSSSAS